MGQAHKNKILARTSTHVTFIWVPHPPLWRSVTDKIFKPQNEQFEPHTNKTKIRMKWWELREYKWNEYVTIAVNRNLSNSEKARKKGFRGFNGIRTRGLCVSAAVLYQPELWRPIHWMPANLLSSHHFILCFIPFTGWWGRIIGRIMRLWWANLSNVAVRFSSRKTIGSGLQQPCVTCATHYIADRWCNYCGFLDSLRSTYATK